MFLSCLHILHGIFASLSVAYSLPHLFLITIGFVLKPFSSKDAQASKQKLLLCILPAGLISILLIPFRISLSHATGNVGILGKLFDLPMISYRRDTKFL